MQLKARVKAVLEEAYRTLTGYTDLNGFQNLNELLAEFEYQSLPAPEDSCRLVRKDPDRLFEPGNVRLIDIQTQDGWDPAL